ncbi:AbrB/MazE/SpoVT family DNA-binding domain-containing protein [Beggiatoa alba]|nr:AbrB/MazE/SpoVT family DNA-binding domain-containing protein [Beggiatoa alba]
MPKVSSKRQITIPIDQCQQANIEPGDEIETFIYGGHITIVKKEKGAAKGILSQVKADKRVSDEKSLQSTLDERHKGAA